MSISTLKRLSDVLEKKDIQIVSIESMHTLSRDCGDITELNGGILSSAGRTMIEIRVIMPTE